ncbi:hypothetical protein [Metaclostridioides mangenotii]|uniref:hypothetical protein n=1 Tax=Metaclostridioides mangenotii TaxID=1540 RepID=UPI0004876427|nr:hypothetical protein [Clostridioides mangenotii]
MITFDINDANIKFDVQMENYNAIRKLFKFRAIEESKKFKDDCMKNFHSLKQISERGLKLGDKYLTEAFKLGVETIVGYEIITIDVDTFKDIYCDKYLDFYRLFNNYNKSYLIPNKNKKNNIVNIQEIEAAVDKLHSFIQEDFFNIHFAVVDVLLENKITKVRPYIDEESINQSNALFNNYKDGFISKPDECKVVKQIIELNPYREDLYKFLIKEDGDLFNEIDNLTKFLGYSMDEYKEGLMNSYIDSLIENRDSFYDSYDKMKEKIEKYAKYIGCKDESFFVTKLDAIYTFANA